MNLMKSICIQLTAVGIIVGTADAGETVTYVHPLGFFDPSGEEFAPFQTAAAAICAAPEGGDVLLAPATYYESFSTNKPARLTTNVPVTLGVRPSSATTLTVVSYNTHLFGNAGVVAPTWLDEERAPYIGEVVGDEAADIVGLQEVWDTDHMNTIFDEAGYFNGFYGDEIDTGSPPSILNSGLLLMSPYPLQDAYQVFYADETGFFESLASKGWVQASITKDGFTAAVFVTHTQAEEDEDAVEVRKLQIDQLTAAIVIYRSLHPTHAVVVMGDFNVPGETFEYVDSMREQIGFDGGTLDAGRNQPCTGEDMACTSCADNELNQYFHDFGEITEKRLDYGLYANSFDGSVQIRPLFYERRKYQVPSEYGELCDDDGFCTRDLSDHYGFFAEFSLYRP